MDLLAKTFLSENHGGQFDGLQSTRSLSPWQALSGPHHAAYQLHGCHQRVARIRRPRSLNFVLFFLLCMFETSLNTWTCKTWEVPKYRLWRTCEMRGIWFLTSIITLVGSNADHFVNDKDPSPYV